MRTRMCVACGKCVLGCKLGAKWTADKLLEGLDQSLVDVMESCTVTKLTCENNHVTGVVCRQGLRTVTLDGDLVLLAAGGVGTPKILDRSGVPSKPTFFVDPVLCVAAPWENARFDSEIPMPFASQRDGYILSPYFDFLSFFFDKKWRAPSKDIFSLMIKFADDEVGSVTARTVSKPLTDHDYETMARAVDDCRRIMGRLGIRESDTFYGMLNAGHPGGAYPLTQAEAETLHHQELPDNLYLADSTLFNASMGNPPILTIMALAKKVAKTAAAR
ncbi:GMC family oxidoreductase N-terminal domain-containing protein [Slackia heliotrinireducens]|uniref:GMC family oxidoreductase N-terminal domain-containing protein n=1 Tax=Slackia heliotrinireducens TaxID=84110 RepID=UPI003315DFDA